MPYRRDQMFGDVEHYQAKQEIKKRFDKVLVDLQKIVKRNGYAVISVQRFRGCLSIQKLGDVAILPVYSPTPLSKKRNRIHCVLCLISYTMQRYWEFCGGNQEIKETIDYALSDLENYAVKGLKAFRITESGNLRGYFLGEIR